MIIVRVMGGLGNQLQQYALYRKLEHIGRDARIDTSWFDNQAFQASVSAGRELEMERLVPPDYKKADEQEIRAVLGRLWEEPASAAQKIKYRLLPASKPFLEETDMYHDAVWDKNNCYLAGYWAADKYYADIMDILRREITFPRCDDDEVRRRNEDVIRQMQETVSVSVHIRRGDYLDEHNRALFGGICTERYYDGAFAYLRERYPQAEFFFFSDDPAYVREHYRGERCHVIDWNRGGNSLYDMMLMSRCRHHICANSTFSFWGARLNPDAGKVMIRPSVHKNTQRCIPEQMKELWKGWTLITPQGGIV